MKEDNVQPRRQFFQWMKQVTAGVSIATLGIAAASTPAFAALNQSSEHAAAASPNQPNCIPCPDYGTPAGSSCVSVNNCYPSKKLYTSYIYISGCTNSRYCPTTVNSSSCGC